MKTVLYFLVPFWLMLFSPALSTQTDDLEKALRALREKDFNTAKTLIDQIITKNTFDAGGYYALSIFYSDKDNKPYDYFKAFDYLVLAEKYHSTLTIKESNNLQKLGVTLAEMQKLKHHVGQQAVDMAISKHDLAMMDKVIARFASLPDVVGKATSYKNEAAYEDTKRINTYQAYQNFFVRYPNAKQAPEARQQYEKMLYESLTADGTWQSYQNFHKHYPSSPYREQAKQRYEKLYYEQRIQTATSISIVEAYLREHTDGPYTPKARERIQSLSSLLPIRIGGGWGFINGSGRIVIAPTFERVGNFSHGLARVRKNGKWGFVNSKGEEVIPMVFELARDFSEGVAAVMQRHHKTTEAFYIDSIGKTLFNKAYFTDGSYWPIHAFKDGLAAVEDPETKKIGFVDRKGNFVVAPLFNSYSGRRGGQGMYPFSSFSQGYAWVRSEEGYGLIDTKGMFLVKDLYQHPFTDSLAPPPFYYRSFVNGLCLIEESTGAFYMDASGKKTITMPVGFTAMPFSDGVAWTRSKYDRNYYLIDTKGKTIFSIDVNKAYPFHEDMAVVQRNPPANRVYFYDQAPEPSCTYIDKTGKTVFNFKFDIPNEALFENSRFRNGIACILLNGKQTYINKEGKILWQSPERWN